MPDGTLTTQIDPNARTVSEHEYRDMLVDFSREALDRAISALDLETLSIEARALLREAYVATSRERMNNAAQVHELEVSAAEERGERLGETRTKLAIARGAKIAADAMAIARKNADRPRPVPAPATSRHPMSELVRFTTGAAAQLRKNISTGFIAVGGMMRRGELPQLERRVDAVYVSCALGQAAGDAMALHLAVSGEDPLLARTMREAFVDGMNTTFGAVVDELCERVN